jgi:succinate dehydrogenase / fumarate reductase, cytochrome b subunit
MSSTSAIVERKPSALLAFYRSSIGKKWVVALTGLILVGFVIGHLIGNLQIFLPPDYINSYAQKLQSLGPILWLIRLFMLTAFALHVINTIELVKENREARPARYEVERTKRATKASLTMIISGLILLAFILFHIAHFTVRAIPLPDVDAVDQTGRHDVHRMMISSFQNVWVSAFYLISMALLCMHITHGFQSVFQTLGMRTRRLAPLLTATSVCLGWFLFLGNAAIVLAILLRLLK